MVDPSSFVHPQAAVTGDVTIGKQVYIGPGAAIRGDWGKIIIEDGCNVQENCTIHLFPGATVRLHQGAQVGHGAIVHGATIGRNCLIGMNAVVMDNVVIEDECIVGALSFVKAGTIAPARSLLAGNPARILKQVSDEMLHWKTEGTAIYQQLPKDMQESWKPCEPLLPGDEAHPSAAIPSTEHTYRPWRETGHSIEESAAPYGHGRQSYTIEEYLRLENQTLDKHEYYKGEIFLMSGIRVDHVTIGVNLVMNIGPKLKGGPCKLFNDNLRVHVEANTLYTYPDLIIICGEPVFTDDLENGVTNPGVIIEILSSSTQSYDRGDKFRLYQDLPSLREYILVDYRSVLVEYFRRQENGSWPLQKYDQLADSFHIETAGVSLTLSDIYENVRFLKAR